MDLQADIRLRIIRFVGWNIRTNEAFTKEREEKYMKTKLVKVLKGFIDALKGVKGLFVLLSWYGKVGLVVLFLFVNFVLPNVLFMPPLIAWCNKKERKIKEKKEAAK